MSEVTLRLDPAETIPVVSVVAPVFNEEESIVRFVERTDSVLRSQADAFEIVLVDDGSRDKTWHRIVELTHANPRLRGIRLSRNFGHQAALLAGLSTARGSAVLH